MLRKVRIILAVVMFVCITFLFVDLSGVAVQCFGWMAKIQFLPALLALNVGAVALLLVLTFCLGRVYCSVVCPLGVMQDVFSRLGGKVWKNRFHYAKPRTWVRWGVVAAFVALMLLGLNSIAILIAPYSAYGRVAANLFAPLYTGLNNLAAALCAKMGCSAFGHVDVFVRSGLSLVVALVTFVLLGLLSFRWGRWWCGNICPVGTLLGVVSRYALFRPVIDTDKCNGCTKCVRNCKAMCIDGERHQIDYSRCVACVDCLENCRQGAIAFRYVGPLKHAAPKNANGDSPADPSRRKMMAATAMVTAGMALQAQERKVDGGLAVLEDKREPARSTAVKPAGAVSLKYFSNHCTACQLCVAECPSQVLVPSKRLDTMLQPEMQFRRGFCRPECTRCSEICPAGAIKRVTPQEKSAIHIGTAVVVLENCVANRDGVHCGNCERHCPAGAIVMVPKEKGADPNLPITLKIPTVDASRCIGCGSCEYHCPSRPFSAIYVEGLQAHVTDN